MRSNLACLGSTIVFAAISFPALAATHEVYTKAGFLGAGLGYAYGVSETFTLRGDISSAGRFKHNFTIGDVSYDGKVRNDHVTLYADWFPVRNGFRLTAGLGWRDSRIDAKAMYTGKLPANVPAFDGDDYGNASVKYPDFAPYIGIGWGHNVGQKTKAGWGFVFDAGVSFGKPKTNYVVSDSARAKIDLATGGNAHAEIDKRQREFEDKVNKYRVYPSAYIGISYTF